MLFCSLSGSEESLKMITRCACMQEYRPIYMQSVHLDTLQESSFILIVDH